MSNEPLNIVSIGKLAARLQVPPVSLLRVADELALSRHTINDIVHFDERDVMRIVSHLATAGGHRGVMPPDPRNIT